MAGPVLFVFFLSLRIGQVCVAAVLPRVATSTAVDTPVASVATAASPLQQCHTSASQVVSWTWAVVFSPYWAMFLVSPLSLGFFIFLVEN